jgi:protein SCO1/2
MPGELKNVSFEQRLGETLPTELEFVDEDGRTVRLGDLFAARPTVLTFVYYECPMLCTLTLNGLAKSLDVVDFDVGDAFDVVVVSIDPGEGPAEATAAKAETVKRYGREATAPGWHFLTGDQASITRLAEAAGFNYTYLPESDEYAHTSGILLVTPEGRLSKYFYGIEFPPKDVRLALVEASDDKIGTVVDQVLLYCFRFDPQLGKYTAATMRILRLVGGIFALGLIAFLFTTVRRERARSQAPRPTLGAL